jgi:hypothetical protein
MEFPTLARGARLISLGLQNESGQDIGKVVEWVMDLEQGRIAYVIAEFFDAPGYYPIPWKVLTPNSDRTGYHVDQSDVMRTELFMNTHDLFAIAEDPYFFEKIENVYSTPNRVPQRSVYTAPEHARSNGRRAHTYSPDREYVPLGAIPQLQIGD